MTAAAPFARRRHEAMTGNAAPALVIEPLPREEADRLGAAFAAIDPWASYPYPATSLAAYFAADEPGAPRFALKCDGEIVGVAGLRLNWLRGPYLQFLGILPAFQRRGLGAGTLAWVEGEARSSGERNLWVAATDSNAGAIRFYQAHGFAAVAPLPDLVREGRTEILLRKRL
jgi:diamine N-acetyltransferase